MIKFLKSLFETPPVYLGDIKVDDHGVTSAGKITLIAQIRQGREKSYGTAVAWFTEEGFLQLETDSALSGLRGDLHAAIVCDDHMQELSKVDSDIARKRGLMKELNEQLYQHNVRHKERNQGTADLLERRSKMTACLAKLEDKKQNLITLINGR